MKKALSLLALSATALVAVLYLTTPLKAPSISLFSTVSHEDIELEQAFIHYIAKFGRSYASKSEVPQRFELFKKAYKMIMEHNAKPDVTF